MSNVVSFTQYKREKNRRGMCAHGFHKWEICKEKQFDVKQGRLVTVYRCKRCDKQKTIAH